jgi:hypothetical protein
MAYEITRVFISFADTINRKPGVAANSVTGFSVQLPNYVENAVFLELINAPTILNQAFIQLNDWGQSTTSKGKQYWRYVDETSNNRSLDIENSVKRHPVRLRTLDFTLFFADGTPCEIVFDTATLQKGGFELEIYSLNKE